MLSLIGFGVLIVLGLWGIIQGIVWAVVSAGFTGRPTPLCLLPIVGGILLLVVAIRNTQFTLSFGG